MMNAPPAHLIAEWADSASELARLMARLGGSDLGTRGRPALTLAPPCATAGQIAAILAVLYAIWRHTFHCACQWEMAFELHPGYNGSSWWYAISASIAWQLWDRVKPAWR